MGHKGTMESRYTTNKCVLPEMLMTEMHEAYARSEKYLGQTETDDTVQQSTDAAHDTKRDTCAAWPYTRGHTSR